MPSAVFCFESSPTIGGGHAMRSMVLAEVFSTIGWKCNLCISDLTYEMIAPVPFELCKINSDINVDLVVIDNYEQHEVTEKEFRSVAKKILIIDDLANRRHDSDYLIDSTLGRTETDYRHLVPTTCKLMLGPQYALLRPQFNEKRLESLERRSKITSIARVIITMGATDTKGATLTALRTVTKVLPNAAIDVVVGRNYIHMADLIKLSNAIGKHVVIHSNVQNMADLMANADLAIGAGGTTSWERCALGLPSLIVLLAENQREVCKSLQNIGAGVYIGELDSNIEDTLSSYIVSLAQNISQLSSMSERAASICDGRGAQRVLLGLLSPFMTVTGDYVALRLADSGDEQIILEWQSDPHTRRYARNPNIPTADEHAVWFKRRLHNPDCIFTVITYNSFPAGVLRLDKRDSINNEYEISIFISPDYYRLGIASAALQLCRRLLPKSILIAEIFPENIASQKLFRSTGYNVTDNEKIFISYP